MTIGLLNFIQSVGPWLLVVVLVAVLFLARDRIRDRIARRKSSWEPYTRTIESGVRPVLEIGVRRYNSLGRQELQPIDTVSVRDVADEPDLLHTVQAKASSTAARLNARSEQYEGF